MYGSSCGGQRQVTAQHPAALSLYPTFNARTGNIDSDRPHSTVLHSKLFSLKCVRVGNDNETQWIMEPLFLCISCGPQLGIQDRGSAAVESIKALVI
jgi:hypothetical protein